MGNVADEDMRRNARVGEEEWWSWDDRCCRLEGKRREETRREEGLGTAEGRDRANPCRLMGYL